MKRSACWYTGYVRDVADMMGLKDWRIYLTASYIDGSHLAEVERTYGRKDAAISLVKGFDNYQPEEQRYGIVHELMHCHFMLVDQVARVLPDPLSEPYNLAMEYGIDAAATALAPHMPLPYYRKVGKK